MPTQWCDNSTPEFILFSPKIRSPYEGRNSNRWATYLKFDLNVTDYHQITVQEEIYLVDLRALKLFKRKIRASKVQGPCGNYIVKKENNSDSVLL